MLTELSELAHKTRHWREKKIFEHYNNKNIWGPKNPSTWLPTLLPLDSCLACQREPTMLSRLDLVWSTAPPLTPCNKEISLGIKIKGGVMILMQWCLCVWTCGHASDICCLEHQDIKTSNIRQIENTTNIFWRLKYFFWRTPAKHRAVAKCVAAVLGWISSGKMSLVTINSCQTEYSL